MSDESVRQLLRSDQPLVLIEASAGCGKTFQGAEYAKEMAGSFGSGRLLILTHTHAACGVFAERTKEAGERVEIKTIDALIGQIATAYYKPLGLPSSVASWAWKNDGEGFGIMAARAANFLNHQPMVARALVRRYPLLICDEHQDSTVDQHSVIMALHRAGAALRIFGDPMQNIYGGKTDREAKQDKARWEELKKIAACAKLDHPHRWRDGCPALGEWILSARNALEAGQQIDLTKPRPSSLRVITADNISMHPKGYQLSQAHRRPIDALVSNTNQMMILASQNSLVTALNAFWGRRIPIWEGHTRDALASLVNVIQDRPGDNVSLASAVVDFMCEVGVGFSATSHGNRLVQEVKQGCARRTTGKPSNIQMIARQIVDAPSHIGVAAALDKLRGLIEGRAEGFKDIKIDRRVEFRDAIRLGQFDNVDEGFAEIARKRSYARPSPPDRALSSIHKAKGLECENTMIMACDKTHFSSTTYARCKMYVALSRAKKSLTLVVPSTKYSPLFRLL